MGNTRVTYSVKIDTSCTLITLTTQTALDYYPYGKELRAYNSGGEKYKSTTNERDLETGYDFRGLRSYDHNVARFKSVEPLLYRHTAWNSYHYVVGNPLSYIDPWGLDSIPSKQLNMAKLNTETDVVVLPEVTISADKKETTTTVPTLPFDIDLVDIKFSLRFGLVVDSDDKLEAMEKLYNQGLYKTTQGVIKPLAAATRATTRQIDFVKTVKIAKTVTRLGSVLTILGVANDTAELINGDDNGDITLAASTHYVVKMAIVGISAVNPLLGFGLSAADYMVGDAIEEYFTREQPILILDRK